MAAITEKNAMSALFTAVDELLTNQEVVFTQPEITDEEKAYVWFSLSSQITDLLDTAFNILYVDLNISTATYSQALDVAEDIEAEFNKTTLETGSGNIFIHIVNPIWFVEDVGEGKIRYRYIMPMKLRNKYTE